MKQPLTQFLVTITALLFAGAIICSTAEGRKRRHGYYGSKKDSYTGILTYGVQAGSHGTTGVTGQYFGLHGGALNFGVGLSLSSISLHGDYLLFLDGFTKFKNVSPKKHKNYRGKALFYTGLGAQLGYGIMARAPIGLQYMMQDHPVDYYGGLALVLGSYVEEPNFPYIGLGWNLGIRMMF